MFLHNKYSFLLINNKSNPKTDFNIFLPNYYSFLLVGSTVKNNLRLLSVNTSSQNQFSQDNKSNIEESITGLSPPSIEVNKNSENTTIRDKNKRDFIKAAGIAGASIIGALFLPKKADALILGSSPTTGVVGVKDASNNRINPATEETVSTLAKETTVSQLLKTSDLVFESGAVKVKIADPSAFSDSSGIAKSGLVDSDRHIQVDVLSSALPTSASTEGTLQTIAFGGTKFAIRFAIDSINTNLEYIGEASPGTLSSAALWRIKRIDNSNGITIQWADGNASFDNVWDNRESLSYS
jgi:hypothetical protein